MKVTNPATTCGGGLHMVDARDPKNLSFAGCYNDTAGANPRGYTHDAQCLVYRGPDAGYRGRQICVGSNEREINIADVTDKSNPTTIGRGTYPNAAYTHQGWFDDEQRYFYQNDEIDEPTRPRQVAFFDSAPLNDDGPGHSASESGAWSNYPFFDGDFVVFTSVREGLFIVRVPEDEPAN